jgi:hypothetical protein
MPSNNIIANIWCHCKYLVCWNIAISDQNESFWETVSLHTLDHKKYIIGLKLHCWSRMPKESYTLLFVLFLDGFDKTRLVSTWCWASKKLSATSGWDHLSRKIYKRVIKFYHPTTSLSRNLFVMQGNSWNCTTKYTKWTRCCTGEKWFLLQF